MMRPEFPTVAITPSVRTILNTIMGRDPSGGEIEPTQAAYEAHQRWTVETFGKDMWTLYSQGNWAESPDV